MGDDRKKKGSYAVGVATRESILVAASEMIADVGYHGMSLRDLARRVGISHPAVIYHFPNKESMISMIMLRCEELMGFVDVEIDEKDGSLIPSRLKVESVNELAIAFMRLALHPEADKLMAVSSVIEHEANCDTHPLHYYIKARRTLIQEFWLNAIHEARQSEHFQFLINEKFVATMLMTLWAGTKQAACNPDDTLTGLDRITTFLATCVIYLRMPPENLVAFAASLPEELASAFVRTMNYVNTFLD